ncbi:GIY-YIG catalytic domain-containing endonuclease [Acanthocystis turfacea Chlorella virus GM0701.1]|nr:GIY-YIG catalytic domain-containing endonuclease [Acanthocystis turfacea Chlorella virus GM0701.1]
MIVEKKYFDIINTLYFVLDNVMFWEAYRWERLNLGYIYIQKFSNDMMYAGLTIDLKRRMNTYKKLKGNNTHHTRALKKYIDTMQIAFTQCPHYLLDAVEIFVIAFFDLTNPMKGYNKTTGGRNGYRMTKDVRMKISDSKKGKKNPNYGKYGELSSSYGRRHTEDARFKMAESTKGENHPNFGKQLPEEVRANMSIAKTGENNPFFGKTHTQESRVKMSASAKKGGKHHNAKPICVFGKLYGSASTASATLCEVCNTASNEDFIRKWTKSKKHQHNVFYVAKEFYTIMKDTMDIITRDIYERWTSQI